jgi:nicotinamidase-related amidase
MPASPDASAPSVAVAGVLDRDRCTLVLVDHQARLMPAIACHEAVVEAALFVARVARRLAVPVVVTEQNPQGLGPAIESIRALADRTVAKRHFDACRDGLLQALQPPGHPVRPDVVIAGCEAHVCLLQTALGLRSAGHAVAVVAEACGSRRASDRALALERLAQAGCSIVSPEMVAFEWLRSCDDAGFRDVLALVKAREVVRA